MHGARVCARVDVFDAVRTCVRMGRVSGRAHVRGAEHDALPRGGGGRRPDDGAHLLLKPASNR